MRRDLDSDREAAEAQGIGEIDLVVVNLYPFAEVTAQPDCRDEDAIEMIDIGGPGMLRSSAKNHAWVSVLSEPSDYPEFLSSFAANEGATLGEERRRWARKVFATTAAYDAMIAEYLAGDELLPERLVVPLEKQQELRYGENPHQRAAIYHGLNRDASCVAQARVHGGKALSFNNYLDANAALECVRGLPEFGVAVIKHKNPCGASVVEGDQLEAFKRAHAGDTISAYGGILALNRPLGEATAREIATSDKFFEVIVAPGYEGGSIEILQTGAKWGAKLRILEVAPWGPESLRAKERELRWIRGGLLVQEPDASLPPELEIVSQRAPTTAELADLRFAWAICPHVTSNAIVFAKDRRLIGVGAGQMSRIDSVEFASKKGGDDCLGAVMASDAFFPFDDGVRAAHAAGVRAVVQPGGSIRDKKVIAACDELGMAMVLTGRRHFRH